MGRCRALIATAWDPGRVGTTVCLRGFLTGSPVQCGRGRVLGDFGYHVGHFFRGFAV